MTEFQTYEIPGYPGLVGMIARGSREPRAVCVINHGNPGVPQYLRDLARLLASKGVQSLVVAGDGQLPPRRVVDVPEAERRLWRTQEFADRYLGMTRAAAESLAAEAGVPLMLVGYCGGGWQVLKLAADGLSAERVVAFHPPLRFHEDDPRQDALDFVGEIRAAMQFHLGGRDPVTPASDIAELREVVDGARLDATVFVYDDALHGFTDPESDAAGDGVAYEPAAAQIAVGRAVAFLAAQA